MLVTGCTEGGIGHALCVYLHRRGCRLFATQRRAGAAGGLEQLGIPVLTLDVQRPESCMEAVDDVIAAAGRLDVLVNNAGAHGLWCRPSCCLRACRQVAVWLGMFCCDVYSLPRMARQQLYKQQSESAGTMRTPPVCSVSAGRGNARVAQLLQPPSSRRDRTERRGPTHPSDHRRDPQASSPWGPRAKCRWTSCKSHSRPTSLACCRCARSRGCCTAAAGAKLPRSCSCRDYAKPLRRGPAKRADQTDKASA